MDLKFILIALAVVGLLGYLLLGSQTGVGTGVVDTGPQPPVITEIEFPDEITADSSEVDGAVRFSDPDGDLAEARFEVVESLLFAPFSINLSGAADGVTSGAIPFYLQTGVEQSVIIRVVLVDQQGQESEPVQFSFTAVPAPEEEQSQ